MLIFLPQKLSKKMNHLLNIHTISFYIKKKGKLSFDKLPYFDIKDLLIMKNRSTTINELQR